MPKTNPKILETLQANAEPAARRLAWLLSEDNCLGQYSINAKPEEIPAAAAGSGEHKAEAPEQAFVRSFAGKLKQVFQPAPIRYSNFLTHLTTLQGYFSDTEGKPASSRLIQYYIAPYLFLAVKFPDLRDSESLANVAKQMGNKSALYLDTLLQEQVDTAPLATEKGSIAHFKAVTPALLQEEPLEEIEGEGEEEDATIASSPGKKKSPSPVPGKKPSSKGLLPPLRPLQAGDLLKLSEDCLTRTQLAAYSTYENNKKAEILRTNARLLQVLSEHKESESPRKTALVEQLEKASKLLADTTAPLSLILHFGTRATLTSKEGKQTVYDEKTPTPLIQPTQLRSTELNLDGKTVEIKEKYRDNGTFVSQTHLSSELKDNQLRIWARAAITSFLTAAPQNSKPTFEDGLRPQQLAAVISYCNFMDYDYDLGPMQKLRLFGEKLRTEAATKDLLPEAEWEHLKKNEAVTIDPTVLTKLAAAINATEVDSWCNENLKRFPVTEWQKMSPGVPAKIPLLGEEERKDLLTQMLQKPAHTSKTTPAADPKFFTPPFARLELENKDKEKEKGPDDIPTPS